MDAVLDFPSDCLKPFSSSHPIRIPSGNSRCIFSDRQLHSLYGAEHSAQGTSLLLLRVSYISTYQRNS